MYIRIVFFPIGDALEKVPTQILKRIEYRESLVYYILLDARLYARSNQEEKKKNRKIYLLPNDHLFQMVFGFEHHIYSISDLVSISTISYYSTSTFLVKMDPNY